MTVCIAMLDRKGDKIVCGTDSAATESSGDQYRIPAKVRMIGDKFAVMFCGDIRGVQSLGALFDRALSGKKKLSMDAMIAAADEIDVSTPASRNEDGELPFQFLVAGAGSMFLVDDDLSVLDVSPVAAIGSGSSNVVGMCELLKKHTTLSAKSIVRKAIESVCEHRSDCRPPVHVFEV